MANHGVNALDEHVMGRCHVAKSREACFHFEFQRRLTLPERRSYLRNRQVACLLQMLINVSHKDTGTHQGVDIGPLWTMLLPVVASGWILKN